MVEPASLNAYYRTIPSMIAWYDGGVVRQLISAPMATMHLIIQGHC